MKVGLIVNAGKTGAAEACQKLRETLARQGIEPVLEREAAEFLGESDGLPGPELAKSVDLVAVLGGDGTMLRAIDVLDAPEIPVAGINIGHLGFLTTCTDDEIPHFVTALVEQSHKVSIRTLIRASVLRPNGQRADFLALNEAVLARGYTGRLVSLTATINGELLNHYRADGLIVATPTGSTAYSLSAGGPLISPSAGVFVITPICPHTLSQRSLVVNNSAEIRLSPNGMMGESMIFTIDGRDCAEIHHGDEIIIRKSSRLFRLVRFGDRSFYAALRQKLHWRGG